jgi:hypothetical protein
MLPSVSPGSAALTKYANAVAIAAPEEAHRDSDAAPRPEQEAARQNAEKNPVQTPQQDTLARDARATVEALLNLLRSRVLSALTDLGISQEIALKAANSATVQLAGALAGESRHGAEIVHALLEKIQAGQSGGPEKLLQLAARGLTVLIDHQTGDVRITAPRIDVLPSAGAAAPGRSTPHHLLDFTDRNTQKAAPVLQALGEVQSVARNIIATLEGNTAPPAPAVTPPSAVIVAPDAFVTALTVPLTAALRNTPAASTTPYTAPDAAQAISRALSGVIATTLNNTVTAGNTVSVGEVMTAVRHLQPVEASGNDAKIVLSADKVSVALDTRNGAITVQVGNRVTAYAPASLPQPGTAIAPLEGIAVASIPVDNISSRLPVGKILDQPAGVPFIPPAFDKPVLPATPPPPGQAPTATPPAQNAAAIAADETLRHLDPAAARNATILRSIGPAPAADIPALTRIALDISAEVAPGAPVAINAPVIGKFGLPRPAPAQTENGPVLKHGYADASANLPPVLPAVHMRGEVAPEDRRRAPKRKQQQKQLPPPENTRPSRWMTRSPATCRRAIRGWCFRRWCSRSDRQTATSCATVFRA